MVRLGVLIVALYFFLVDGCQLIDYIVDLVPMEKERTRTILATSREVAVGVLLSMVVTSGAQTVVALIGYLIAGVDLLALVVAATFLFGFIPALGGASVTTSAGVVLWLSGRTGSGIFLIIWGLAVVSVVDNIVKPYVAKQRAHLPGSIVFFAMICGLAVFGPMGLVGGPLVVACFHVMAQMVREDRIAARVSEPAESALPPLPHPKS
jgi:predicted PurR-regulated permease PerM